MATVLVVDDDRDVRDMLRTAFHLDQHAVADANGYTEGRDLALILNPDVIVTDHKMGRDGTGVQLIRDLRDLGMECPIIFWTASPEIRELALAAGADYVLIKNQDSLAMLRAKVSDSTRPNPFKVVKHA